MSPFWWLSNTILFNISVVFVAWTRENLHLTLVGHHLSYRTIAPPPTNESKSSAKMQCDQVFCRSSSSNAVSGIIACRDTPPVISYNLHWTELIGASLRSWVKNRRKSKAHCDTQGKK